MSFKVINDLIDLHMDILKESHKIPKESTITI